MNARKIMQLLTRKQQDYINEERKLLNELYDALIKLGASEEDQRVLRDSINQLDDFFLLVIVGEFNAGKSAFINALIGEPILKEGVTPTTTRVHVLRHGEDEGRVIESEHLHVLTAPVTILENLSIVDTPGTNAIIREHEIITNRFMPRADLVLFVTSADRPFSESERAFLEQIRDWGKKVVVVLNKVDLLQSETEITEIVDFIRDNARGLLGITPEIFALSARKALQAKQGQPGLWPESRFELLENYIQENLDEESRLTLKFLNPVGIGERLVSRYLSIVQERLELLKEDFATLEDVDQQLSVYETDMERDFQFRMSDIEKILYEMENRGDAYFEDTIRIARVIDLIRKDRIQREFEEQVVGDVPVRLENRVDEMIDWLVDSDLRQWQTVTDHLAERRRKHRDRIVGGDQVSNFHMERERLIDGVGRETRRVVDGYDKVHEAQKIASDLRSAVAATAVLEVGAVGLGVIITALATTMAIDVTGIIMASVLALLGIFVLPAKRRQARKQMHQRVADMRETLVSALTRQFEAELNRSLNNIREAISPYTRFVRAEGSKLESAKEEMEAYQKELGRLRSQIEP